MTLKECLNYLVSRFKCKIVNEYGSCKYYGYVAEIPAKLLSCEVIRIYPGSMEIYLIYNIDIGGTK